MNEFAARATPPPMQRVIKRLPTPQINRKTENTQGQWRRLCVTHMEVQKSDGCESAGILCVQFKIP